MYIESISLRNFRCFGNQATRIDFSSGITGFVGDNGSGKTSVLDALKRLFSPEANDRQLQLSDVHFGFKEDSNKVTEREIVIDVVFNVSSNSAIPLIFKDLYFSAQDSSLKVRLLLEGHFIKSDSNPEDIETKIYSVRTLDEVPFGDDDERKVPVQGKTTKFAELAYIPAHRDSIGVTRHALSGLLKRLIRSADWDEETINQSQNFAEKLEKELKSVSAVNFIENRLRKIWENLYDGYFDANPFLSVVATDFEKLIRSLTLRFEKTPDGTVHQLEELSEGQISLLYFAISATLQNLIWNLEESSTSSNFEIDGFKTLDFVPAPLIVFAFEEPENHLAPFYLPRLIGQIKSLIDSGIAQSFITSHSTSVLSRLEPQNVRFFRNDRKTLTSTVQEFNINENCEDDQKFLNIVIRSNPEIYFSRLVIIGEGDSERVVIPRIAEAFGVPLDPSFVAFVSIGGRHAKYLWRLTAELKIPTLTLLDFDMGRHNGGMGRIKNAIDWFHDILGDDIKFSSENVPKNEEVNSDVLNCWIRKLENQGVYFSYPLDLDMMMIDAFPAAYKFEKSKYPIEEEDMTKIRRKVFGEQGEGNQVLKFINHEFEDNKILVYNQLFKSSSKPVSHYNGLKLLSEEEIVKSCPKVLKRIIIHACNLLNYKVPNELRADK